MSKAAETHSIHNTLACIVRLCLGKVTTVELRNEAFVTGRIVDVDGFMNITMKEAEFSDPMREKSTFQSFFVQNRLIRYVQIPTEIDMKAEMYKMFDPLQRSKRSFGGQISGGRKKILHKKEKRRQEDIANAIKLKEEMKQKTS